MHFIRKEDKEKKYFRLSSLLTLNASDLQSLFPSEDDYACMLYSKYNLYKKLTINL